MNSSAAHEDEHTWNLIMDHSTRCCDYSFQEVEFLPISPILENFPVLLPVRLDAIEPQEKLILDKLEKLQ
jgi:hypothetical protein